MLAFVSMTLSVTTLPAAFRTAIEMLSLCTSMPIYLVLVIGRPPSGAVEPSTRNLLHKGRPFILRELYGLRSRLHRSRGKDSAAFEQPIWSKSVKYVSG